MPRRVEREHILQRHLRTWVRDALDVPHLFLAFDRTAPFAQFSHARQAARGVRRGTPDTLLIVASFPGIWCELKAQGEKPNDDQAALGAELTALGQHWFWVDEIRAYWLALKDLGVPMRANAEYQAEIHDGTIASVIAKAEVAAGTAAKRNRKPFQPKPTAARIRRTEAVRGRIPF